jgi:hypothetical protein
VEYDQAVLDLKLESLRNITRVPKGRSPGFDHLFFSFLFGIYYRYFVQKD